MGDACYELIVIFTEDDHTRSQNALTAELQLQLRLQSAMIKGVRELNE